MENLRGKKEDEGITTSFICLATVVWLWNRLGRESVELSFFTGLITETR